MKNSKKGISLIVLVITILVIIILAAAVLLSLNNNNPITNSKQAAFDNDVSEVRSAINLYISNFLAKNPTNDGPFNPDTDQDWIMVCRDTVTNAVSSVRASTADGTTTYGNCVTWKDLGLNDAPSTIRTMFFNVETAQVIAIPTQTSVTFDYDNNISDAIEYDKDSNPEGLTNQGKANVAKQDDGDYTDISATISVIDAFKTTPTTLSDYESLLQTIIYGDAQGKITGTDLPNLLYDTTTTNIAE